MILIVAYPGEEHAARVSERLIRLGRRVKLIDLADFPSRTNLSLSWSAARCASYIIGGTDGTVDLMDARVGWWRRVRPFSIDNALPPAMRAFAESETSQAVNGMLDALPCTWVNPRAADEAAHHKPYQWAVAQSVGLRVPRTLVTSRPEDARAFIERVGVGRTIFKAFLATHESWRETRIVERGDLDRLELVRYAPVIFQEYIEGVDLRVTLVGEEVFAAEIDARRTSYPFDMRMVIGETEMRPVDLPPTLRANLLELQRRLGLVYGAIDLRRTSAGKFFFLEVNPAGQWLFVEQRAGLAISRAVADLLAMLDSRSRPEIAA